MKLHAKSLALLAGAEEHEADQSSPTPAERKAQQPRNCSKLISKMREHWEWEDIHEAPPSPTE